MQTEEQVVSTPASTPFQQWAAEHQDGEETPSAPAPAEQAPNATTAPASEPDEQKVETEEEREERELPKGLKKRFSQLTGKIRDLETQLAAKPAAAEKPGVASPPAAEGTTDKAPVPPKLADCQTYDEYEAKQLKYMADLVDHQLKQRQANEQRERAEATTAAEQKRQAERTGQMLTAAREAHRDYDAIALNPDLAVTQAMFEAMLAEDQGAEVLYHLGKNPQLAAEIAAKSPAAQAVAIGKLTAKLFPEGGSTTETKPAVTSAPRPPKPVNAGSGADLGAEPDPKDFAKWSKWKDRKERLERGD